MSTVTNETTEDQVQTPDELTLLKERALMMQIKFHPNIGLDKLKAKVAAKMSGNAETDKADDEILNAAETQVHPVDSQKAVVLKMKQEDKNTRNRRLKRNAEKLVRVRITCMNPNKKDWSGEIITVSNKAIGTIRKFVQFDAEDGYHIENAIFLQLIDRKCQVFVTGRDARGNKVRKSKMIKEYGIEVMDQLSPVEIKELAERQALSHSIDR